MPPEKTSEAEHIIAVAREAERNQAPKQIELEGHPLLLTKDDRIISLERFMAKPRRQRATVLLYEAASFIDYVNAHNRQSMTHIFAKANERGGEFCAIIDYHPRGLLDGGHGDHICKLILEATPEWKRWIEKSSQLLTQESFAEFIEDNLTDIIEPDGATILEMAQLLQGKKSVAFKAGRNLRDGSIQLEYSEEIQLNGGGINRRDDTMKLPEKFKLGICPFVGANGVEIEARLRFRISNGGSLHFAYILNRPFKVVEEAFLATRSDIESKTKIQVHLGTADIRKPE